MSAGNNESALRDTVLDPLCLVIRKFLERRVDKGTIRVSEFEGFGSSDGAMNLCRCTEERVIEYKYHK